MSFIRLAARNLARPRLASVVPRTQNFVPWRAAFSAAAGLTKDTIETRILDVLRGFEKVNPSKVLFELRFTCLIATYTFLLAQANYHFIIH
jgi:NADH dehydrogenase (ubiquinone) 1 alpha/beta subcomplex 1